ncbi:BRO family, N-terminal domain [Bacillus sp. ok061]|uniref:BRO-N domain-containing protein n=1 Tax=Bacillus sp. ok061 TaxID=1761766 RepID=UPI00089E1D86|nr:BRO family protein [Bacillus sp. ok061]SEG07876.1 BRO family, N-terminal domain [Bacillus sp. ok061]
MSNLSVVHQQEVLGRSFKVYGTVEEPLFLAKGVAEWIDHSNVSKMVSNIDDEEVVDGKLSTLTNGYSAKFLTEDGIYEVLMLSRKPIAKQWKKEVKKILKNIRLNGGHVQIDREEDEKVELNNNYFDEDEKLMCQLSTSGQNGNDR